MPNHDPRTFDIYENIQCWLEEPSERTTYDLRIPILSSSVPVSFDTLAPKELVMCRYLHFIRGRDRQGVYAELVSEVFRHRIYYDPNWRSILAIEEILAEA